MRVGGTPGAQRADQASLQDSTRLRATAVRATIARLGEPWNFEHSSCAAARESSWRLFDGSLQRQQAFEVEDAHATPDTNEQLLAFQPLQQRIDGLTGERQHRPEAFLRHTQRQARRRITLA